MQLKFCRSKRKLFALVVSAVVLYLVVFFVTKHKSCVDKYVKLEFLTKKHIQEKIVQVGDPKPSDVAVVSIYFRLEKSKHSNDEYKEWIDKFFASVTSVPIIIYTNTECADELIRAAYNYNNSKTFHIFNNIWEITTLIELARNVKKHSYVINYIDVQPILDPEREIHSPNLYAIWNAKPFLMKRTTWKANNKYKSKFLIYTDIGAFRDHVFKGWPNSDHFLRLNDKLDGRVLLSRISSDHQKPYSSLTDYVQGTFFAGSLDALRAYSKSFYSIHDNLLKKNEFLGKDQKIMNIYALVRHPHSCCILNFAKSNYKCTETIDIWFSYQFYFSRENVIYSEAQPGNQESCDARSEVVISDVNVIECKRKNSVEFIGEKICFKCLSNS